MPLLQTSLSPEVFEANEGVMETLGSLANSIVNMNKAPASGKLALLNAVDMMPTIAQAAEVYDMSSYAEQAATAVTVEAQGNNAIRSQLEAMKDQIIKFTMAQAEAQNMSYVQQIKAAWGDLVGLNSTVPVVVEQNPATVKNDDALALTTSPTELATKVATDKEKLATDLAAQQMANLSLGDPGTVAKAIQEGAQGVANGSVTAVLTGKVPAVQNDATFLAAMDCTKQASMDLAKTAGECFAKSIVANVEQGTLTPEVLLANFDANMAAVGTAIGTYVGAAVADVPNGNPCASQTMTNYALGCAALINTVNKSAAVVNGLMTFGAKLADQAADLYDNGPELLLAMAETTAQTAISTAFLAMRNAAKTNCAISLAVNGLQNTLAVGETLIENGIAVVSTASELKSSADTLIEVVKNKDFVKDLKDKVNMHPVVRSVKTLLDGNAVDLRTYARIASNGTKFARVMLGADMQNRLSSAIEHLPGPPMSTKSKIDRMNYTTTRASNRYNVYAHSEYFIR